jgi:PmbA protein
MIGKKKVKQLVDCALSSTKADQIEVVFFNHAQALTRFANNFIHQNVSESNTSISIRVAFGQKIGSASTNVIDTKRIKETVKWAEKIARFQKANEYFTSFPSVKSKIYKKLKTFVDRTARFSSTERAEAVADIVRVAEKYNLTTFGSVSNGSAEVCVANSNNTYAYAPCDDVFCNIVMSTGDSTGYSLCGTRDVGEVDFRRCAETAARKALMSQHPVEMPAGTYTTIFEPLAACEFFEFLGVYALNGKMYNEGRSFLSGKLGKSIVDKKLTVTDDPCKKSGFPFPFDFEGVPKRRLIVIDKGVARNVVHDSLTATAAHTRSTGHALTAPNPFGPVPMHLVIRGGDKSLDDMIKTVKRGILVTRFHYTNIIDPHRLTFTGMTRDGTFLIENGTITKGLRNMRFTENIIECLNRVEDIGKKQVLVASEPGYGGRFGSGMIVPAMKIKDFNFTGTTEF